MKFFKLGLLLILFSLIGCEKSREDKVKGLTEFISENRIGRKSNAYLEMNVGGSWEKMVLFFGYDDDYSNCQYLKNYNQRTSSTFKFRCVLAN